MQGFPRVSDFKRRSVAEYLELHFPDCKLADHYDHVTDCQVFRLSKKRQGYVLRISREFFRDRRAKEITEELHRREIAAALEQYKDVWLTNRGLRASTE